MELRVVDGLVLTPTEDILFKCSEGEHIVSAKQEEDGCYVLIAEDKGRAAKLIKFEKHGGLVWDTSSRFRFSRDSILLRDDKFVDLQVDQGNEFIRIYGFQVTFFIDRHSGLLRGTRRGHG